MNGGIKIGKVYGIEVSLDYSWFLIFALITFGLASALFPQLIPGQTTVVYIVMGVVTSLLFFGSVLLHEIMHSIVAKSYGMTVEGIRLMLFGGVSQITEEPPTPRSEFWMAAAGPLSSLVIGGIFLGFFFVGRAAGWNPIANVPLFWLGYVNLLLGVFNLIPGFPLDGGRVLRSIVWHVSKDVRYATGVATGLGKGFAYLMIVVGIAGPFIGNSSLLWFVLIGWYLLRAAQQSYYQAIAQHAMEGIKVGQAMTENPSTVPPDITIESMVKDYFMQHRWVAYPVVQDSSVQGVITINSIKDVPRRSWGRKHVSDVLRPLSTDIVASPDNEVSDVMPKLTTKAEGRLLVMKGGHLIGILTRTDVARAVAKRLRREAEEEEREQKRAA